MREHPEAEVSAAEVARIIEAEAKAAGAVPPGETLKVYGGDADGRWWIGSLGPADGPYVDEQPAIDAAIDRAKTLAEGGHPATVVVQRGEDAWAEVSAAQGGAAQQRRRSCVGLPQDVGDADGAARTAACCAPS